MFCLAEVINFTVNLQPRLVFRWRQMCHQLHQIRHHLLTRADPFEVMQTITLRRSCAPDARVT